MQPEKIDDYLLNAAHPDNNGKAELFETFGFHSRDWETLARAMCQMAANGEVITSLETLHGVKYILNAVIRKIPMASSRPVPR